MASGRNGPRSAYLSSMDDIDQDSIPSLDGGWLKGVNYNPDNSAAELERNIADESEAEEEPVAEDNEIHDKLTPEPTDSTESDNNARIEREIASMTTEKLVRESEQDAPEQLHDNSLETAVKHFTDTIRQTFEDDKKRFQQALHQAFRQRLSKMEREATKQLRKRLARGRQRDKEKIIEREQQLDQMLGRLNRLASEVEYQKKMLFSSSRKFEQRLVESDLVQNELHELGRELRERVEDLSSLLIDEPTPKDEVTTASVARLNPRAEDD